MTCRRMLTAVLLLCCLLAASLVVAESSHAATFVFGTDAGGANGAIYSQTDRSSALLSEGAFTAIFDAGPAGALLDDREHQGLGVDTSQIPGVTEGAGQGDPTKLNIIPGMSPVSGEGESVSFSFNRSGVLRTLLFDGMKDETLEYFSLALPDGSVLTIFDSQTEFRLSVQGYHLADLQVSNPRQAQTEDDDLTGINYAFSAGEVFTITYGEGDYSLVPNYHTNPAFPQFPNAKGDGARFQGVVVVPEPDSVAIGTLTLAMLWNTTTSRVRRRRLVSTIHHFSAMSSPPLRLQKAK